LTNETTIEYEGGVTINLRYCYSARSHAKHVSEPHIACDPQFAHH